MESLPAITQGGKHFQYHTGRFNRHPIYEGTVNRHPIYEGTVP